MKILVSGSTIIQDGKQICNNNHVLVNASKTGYDILIKNMLDETG